MTGCLRTLQWRHNGYDGASNHQPHHCLLNCLFRHRLKKIPKLRVTGICAGNSAVTGEFPARMASNTEKVSIWWHHYGTTTTFVMSHVYLIWQYIMHVSYLSYFFWVLRLIFRPITFTYHAHYVYIPFFIYFFWSLRLPFFNYFDASRSLRWRFHYISISRSLPSWCCLSFPLSSLWVLSALLL